MDATARLTGIGRRPRSVGVWFLPTVLVVVAIASILAWKAVRRHGVGFGRFKVLKMTAEPLAPSVRSHAPAASDRSLVARPSLRDDARLAAGVATAVPVRQVDGEAFIASVEQATRLSPAQHTRLASTFQLAAKLQATIDATDNPDTRANLQRRLDEQVQTRLRMSLTHQALELLTQVDDSRGPVTFRFHHDP